MLRQNAKFSNTCKNTAELKNLNHIPKSTTYIAGIWCGRHSPSSHVISLEPHGASPRSWVRCAQPFWGLTDRRASNGAPEFGLRIKSVIWEQEQTPQHPHHCMHHLCPSLQRKDQMKDLPSPQPPKGICGITHLYFLWSEFLMPGMYRRDMSVCSLYCRPNVLDGKPNEGDGNNYFSTFWDSLKKSACQLKWSNLLMRISSIIKWSTANLIWVGNGKKCHGVGLFGAYCILQMVTSSQKKGIRYSVCVKRILYYFIPYCRISVQYCIWLLLLHKWTTCLYISNFTSEF